MTTALIFIGAGLYLIFNGFTAEYLVDETEGTISDEDKEKYHKATPFRRFVVISGGVGSCGWAIYHLLHLK